MFIIILLLIILYFLCKVKENFSISDTILTPTPIPDALENIGKVDQEQKFQLKKINNFNFGNLENDNIFDSFNKINEFLKNNFEDENYHINEFINLVKDKIYLFSNTKNITILIPTNGIIKAHSNWNSNKKWEQLKNKHNLQLITHCFLYPPENKYLNSKNLNKIVSGINNDNDFILENIKINNGIIHIVNFILNKTTIPYKKQEVFLEFEKNFKDTYIQELYNFGE